MGAWGGGGEGWDVGLDRVETETESVARVGAEAFVFTLGGSSTRLAYSRTSCTPRVKSRLLFSRCFSSSCVPPNPQPPTPGQTGRRRGRVRMQRRPGQYARKYGANATVGVEGTWNETAGTVGSARRAGGAGKVLLAAAAALSRLEV